MRSFSPFIVYIALHLVAVAAGASDNPPLTVDQRIHFQNSIEDVHWRHRIWPSVNQQPKPAREAVVSVETIRMKVENYLRMTNALTVYWQRSITPEQLQSEIDRMIAHSRSPAVLAEIFAAMDNNPHVVAECLARPLLVERLLRSSYSADPQFHGLLKARAKAEIANYGVDGMTGMSGTYSETVLVRTNGKSFQNQLGELILSDTEWKDWLAASGRLYSTSAFPGHATQQRFPIKQLSPLQEDESSFYAIAILEKQESRLRYARVEWRKVSFDEWWSNVRELLPVTIVETPYKYALNTPAYECQPDTWTAMQQLEARGGQTAVWTGTEMIIWGGSDGNCSNTGWRYNPSTDTWSPTSTGENVPVGRILHTAVWTGTEMIIWGGLDNLYGEHDNLNSGGRYNPVSDTWITTSTGNNIPSGRTDHTAVWTGTEMIIWGGTVDGFLLESGGRYNPATDRWTPTKSDANTPLARSNHTAIWTGNEMIIWGGGMYFTANTGGRYSPNTDSWTPTSVDANTPDGRMYNSAVWTGTEMIIWGGSVNTGGNWNPTNSGGRYNPANNTWTPTSVNPEVPVARFGHTAIWTGSEMIIWGGNDYFGTFNTGARYNPLTDGWVSTSSAGILPEPRSSHTAVWTGNEMIVWGGWNGNSYVNTGGRYDPLADSWAPTSTGEYVPERRERHTSVWTGSEMIVWGGWNQFVYLNSGGRYDPATDNWIPTNIVPEVPNARMFHSAIWTGSQMIVWGGITSDLYNTGGLYDPVTDQWSPTIVNSQTPEPRGFHTAIWTGSEMIIWGGSGYPGYLNNGGRYNPQTSNWVATDTGPNVPEARSFHTAVWTGSLMLVWGGEGVTGTFFNTGGRYDPATDSWTTMSTGMNVPEGRYQHAAVWTGNQLLIWGGWNATSYFNTGGRYDPVTDTWNLTTLTGAPEPRYAHSGVWTGEDMIIWSGVLNGPILLAKTGGRYNPIADRWIATNETDAPSGRLNHTAIWTGTQMIVWGGYGSGVLSTGASYCPGSLLFSDEFDDSIVASDWTYLPGNVYWSEDGANMVGSRSRKTTAVANPVFAGCSSNCELQGSINLLSGVDGWASMIGWYTDKFNYVELLLKPAGIYVLKQRVNRVVAAKAKKVAAVGFNQPHSIRVRFDGSQFDVIVDDVLLISMPKAAGSEPAGTVAYRVKNVTAAFDYIRVW
jgi:hypothetical protein